MTTDAIPLADAAALGRAAARTRLFRLALAAGALAAAAAALALALRDQPATPSLLPSGTDGIVVLDVSASVSAGVSRRLASTLDRLARSQGRYGLVLFSDTAYVALPPRSPADEIRPFTRFFRAAPRSDGGTLPTTPESPWSRQFSAGTRISTGLALGLDLAREEHDGRSAVLLVSDLDNSTSDAGALAAVMLEYRSAGVPLRVVGLDPAPEDRQMFGWLARRDAITVAPDPAVVALSESRPRDRRLIGASVLTGVLLAGLLGITTRLRWRRAG